MSINSAGSGTGLFYAYAKNVTDSVAGGYARFKSVKRESLQFFTHNPNEGVIRDTITDAQVCQDLGRKIFFTLLNDRDSPILTTIPILNYPENNSGNRFYVRSIAQPDTYWYSDPSKGIVIASKDRRTLFTITLADRNRAPGTVMIGSDDVLLTAKDGVNIGSINNQGQLGPSKNAFPFRFSSFNGDFQIDYHGNLDETYGGFVIV